jgi:hypothetical protein
MLMTRGELTLDMMVQKKVPGKESRSHGGGTGDSQAGTCRSNPASDLGAIASNTHLQTFTADPSQKLSCLSTANFAKFAFNPMTFRSFSYWFASSLAAVLAASAGETSASAETPFVLPADAEMSILAVPEPSRALLLFIGVMAMAFTYRQAWLNWKRGA